MIGDLVPAVDGEEQDLAQKVRRFLLADVEARQDRLDLGGQGGDDGRDRFDGLWRSRALAGLVEVGHGARGSVSTLPRQNRP